MYKWHLWIHKFLIKLLVTLVLGHIKSLYDLYDAYKWWHIKMGRKKEKKQNKKLGHSFVLNFHIKIIWNKIVKCKHITHRSIIHKRISLIASIIILKAFSFSEEYQYDKQHCNCILHLASILSILEKKNIFVAKPQFICIFMQVDERKCSVKIDIIICTFVQHIGNKQHVSSLYVYKRILFPKIKSFDQRISQYIISVFLNIWEGDFITKQELDFLLNFFCKTNKMLLYVRNVQTLFPFSKHSLISEKKCSNYECVPEPKKWVCRR